MRMVRKIVEIDEERCNGCGLCIPNCPEGALQIIDGKARLVSEIFCDGLGACIGACPQGAITIVEREAEEFDEEAVKQRLKEERPIEVNAHGHPPIQWRTRKEAACPSGRISSELSQWPIQLALVNSRAPYFQGVDLLVVADCVPFAYASFHQDFLRGKSIVIGCPKLDNARFYEKKLTELLRQSDVRSVRVINMEVPCCYGLHFLTQKALENSGKSIPLEQVIISIKGDRKQ